MDKQSNKIGETEISEYWRLSDRLTVKQAILLILGIDPALWELQKGRQRPDGYEAVKQAVCEALRTGAIEGEHVMEINEEDLCFDLDEMSGPTSIDGSKVEQQSLVQWLRGRGLTKGFFFPEVENAGSGPDYLNPNHPRYSAKLAATVSAWQSVSDTDGRSVKQALGKWLREHAGQFRMTDKAGNPISQAVEDCAKVANWVQDGGAPKTPQRPNLPTHSA